MPVRRRATPHIPTPRVANQDGVTARKDGLQSITSLQIPCQLPLFRVAILFLMS